MHNVKKKKSEPQAVKQPNLDFYVFVLEQEMVPHMFPPEQYSAIRIIPQSKIPPENRLTLCMVPSPTLHIKPKNLHMMIT